MLVDPGSKLSNRMIIQAGIQLIGAFLALIFPFLATLAVLVNNRSQVTLASFILVQSTEPDLWLADGFALLFASFFIWSAIQVIRRIQIVEDFKQRIAQRTAELYTLKEMSQREILERHQAEATIIRAKKEWEATFDAISDLILLTDNSGKIIRCNLGVVQKLETNFKSIIGKNIEEVFPGVIEPPQGKTTSKTQVVSLPSSIGWFEVSGFPYVGIENQQGIIYIFHDVTQRKRAEAEIQRQKQFFEGVFQNSPVAIVSLDLNGHLAACNPAFEELFGYTQVQVLGKKLDDLITPVEQREKAQEFNRRVRAGEVIHSVSRRLTASRALIDVEIFSVPVMVNGEELGILGLYHDITELVKARRKAEEADLAKTDFLAYMSHEIRTPLNAIIGALNLALDKNLTTDQSEYLVASLESADSLLTLLNDSLDLAKIEAGKMELEVTDFNLREIVENVAVSQAQRAASKDLELTCIIPPEIPILLRGDSNRLRQILVNLVGNAVKFTERGDVVIQLKKISESGPQVNIGFYIKDTGIGIPPDRQAAIFERFTQGDSSTPRQYGGTGLGLSISAKLVNLLGGKISLNSKEGVGSTFIFNAIFHKQAHGETGPLELLRLVRELRTLVVDANENSALNLKMLIEGMGAAPIIALDSAQCLSQLEQASHVEKPYQMIFIDRKLAVQGNPTLLEQIRTFESNKLVPIVLLTNYAQRVSRKECVEFGCAGYILKPVRLQVLQSMLKEILLPQKGKPAPGPEQIQTWITAEMKSVRPGRILVVEDNPINRKVVVNLLQKFGHRVDFAEDGCQALDALSLGQYDLTLMDIQIPEMDGYETTRRIRAAEGSEPKIIIIAMTAHALSGEVERCIACGMNDYLAKPIKPQDLFAKVEKWLQVTSTGEKTRDDAGKGENKPLAEFVPPEISSEGSGPQEKSNGKNQPATDLEFEAFSHSMDAFEQLWGVPGEQSGQTSAIYEKPLRLDENAAGLGISESDASLPETPQSTTALPLGDLGYMDAILPRFGDDIHFFLKTFEEFIQQCRERVGQMRQAFTDNDLAELKIQAHNLLGIASNFEANQIVTLVLALSFQIEQGDLSHTPELISAIETQIPELEKYLLQFTSTRSPTDN